MGPVGVGLRRGRGDRRAGRETPAQSGEPRQELDAHWSVGDYLAEHYWTCSV